MSEQIDLRAVLTEMEKLELGVPGYAEYLKLIEPQPDLGRLAQREAARIAAEHEAKGRRLDGAEAWAGEQRVRAVKSGALLKAVTRAALIAEDRKRRLAEVEERGARAAQAQQAGWQARPLTSGTSGISMSGEADSVRDTLAQVKAVWEGLSAVWLSSALAEYGVAEVRSEAYANSPIKFHIASDCPFERHAHGLWHDTTYTTYWKTRNPILQNSYARPPASNVMGTPLIVPLESPEMIERRLSNTDIVVDPRMRGAVAGLGLITTKALRVEDEIAEHKAAGTAAERRNTDRERLAAVSAVKEWLAREAMGGARREGGIASFLKRNWAWIAAAVALAALAAFLFLPRTPAAPPANTTTNMTAITGVKNGSVVNGTLVVFGLLRIITGSGMGVA